MTKTIFEVKQQVEKETVDIYIYDYVEGDSYNYWTGEDIKSETSANYIREFLETNKNAKFINLYINSYGGSVKEGLGIYNQLKRHSAYKTAYIDGFACSIASVIPMGCDKVIMGPNTLMMIHHASMGAYGNAEELRKAANDVEIIDKASCSSYLEKAGIKLTEEKLNELLDNSSWLNAKQCLEYGLCDEISSNDEKIKEEATQRYNESLIAEQRKIVKEIKVPEKFSDEKTNAEKLMQIFNKKEGIK